MELLDHAKEQLPRELYLKIVGTLCCDMDTRIRLGIRRKLRIPEGLQRRLEELAKPMKSLHGTGATFLNLGPQSNTVERLTKIRVFYKTIAGLHDVGVLTQSVDHTGIHVTTCDRCVLGDPCRFESTQRYYT